MLKFYYGFGNVEEENANFQCGDYKVIANSTRAFSAQIHSPTLLKIPKRRK
jgi:hypothetical protein